MALADTGRRLDDEDAWRRRVVEGFGDRVGERCQESRLFGARREAGRKVREQVDAIRQGREEWYHAGWRRYDRDVPDDSRVLLEFSAGGLVLDEQGRVLLIRARDLRGQPVWTLPKGALAPGETSAEAALREVREETGYRCELERELAPVTYWFRRDGRQIKKTVRWFLMRPLEKAGDHDHEVDEVLWTDKDDALARLRYDSDRRLVGAI
jgi:8-oxo-dGTP pyrophosphatase MutT (NUDIX family)